ncbi:DUF6114 domain-containing protein [Micromonospora sp. NPDC005979]|uniref:DUF6114 domain-containing protein n=1 Tax=Micromonospora sp. NPDC005979 TaxID=3156726 RepID=UPI0033BC4099
MSTATHRAQPGRVGQAWRGFRRWRRSRPFWGGLFTILAGVEILGTTKVSLAGLTLQMGPTGFLSWLIPTILVTCGLLMWLSPAQRIFYAIVGAVTAVYSLIGVNLGGFFIGMLLGMVGSALGFAWVPVKKSAAVAPAAEEPDGEQAEDGDTADEAPLVDELLPARELQDEVTGPLTDIIPQPRSVLREPAPNQQTDARDTAELPPVVEPGPSQPRSTVARDPKTYVVTLLLMSLASAGLTTVDGASPVRAAAPSCPTPTSSAPSTTPPASPPSASPSPSPSATTEKPDGNLISSIVDGIGDLLTGGDDDKTETSGKAAATDEPTSGTARASESATPSAKPTRSATPDSTRTATPTRVPDAPCVSPKPTKPAPVEPGKPLPKLAADPDMPKVAAIPAKLTGSKVVMTNLRFRGVEPLRTAKGEMRALKFTMSRAVTSDFALLVTGPSSGSLLSETDQLTIDGDVTFYATRFVGRFLGIKVTLTPDLPFPDGIPVTSPLPLTFTDPQIDLAFISCDTLTGRPSLKQTQQ